MNYTLKIDLKKEMSPSEANDYIYGIITKYVHDGAVWDVISCSKDVLPLDNPPKTYNLQLKRENGFTFANLKEADLMERYKDAECFLEKMGINLEARIIDDEFSQFEGFSIEIRNLLVKYRIESELKSL